MNKAIAELLGTFALVLIGRGAAVIGSTLPARSGRRSWVRARMRKRSRNFGCSSSRRVIGAGIAGYLFKSGILSADDVVPDRGAGKSDVPPAASAPTQAALGAQSDSVRRHAGRFSAQRRTMVGKSGSHFLAAARPKLVTRLYQSRFVERAGIEVDLVRPAVLRIDRRAASAAGITPSVLGTPRHAPCGMSGSGRRRRDTAHHAPRTAPCRRRSRVD
jgi:hypothetical protein